MTFWWCSVASWYIILVSVVTEQTQHIYLYETLCIVAATLPGPYPSSLLNNVCAVNCQQIPMTQRTCLTACLNSLLIYGVHNSIPISNAFSLSTRTRRQVKIAHQADLQGSSKFFHPSSLYFLAFSYHHVKSRFYRPQTYDVVARNSVTTSRI